MFAVATPLGILKHCVKEYFVTLELSIELIIRRENIYNISTNNSQSFYTVSKERVTTFCELQLYILPFCSL